MLLRQLKYFVAVVEAGSFTEAAERCHISQSAVSQQIQTLERELGVELLRRKNRSFSLTAAGEHFYRKGCSLLDEMERLCRETAEIAQKAAPRLRVGCLKGYSSLEFQLAVAEFTQDHPEVPIEILNGSHEDLYDTLRLRRADVVLNDQRRAFSDGSIKNIAKGNTEIVAEFIQNAVGGDLFEVDTVKPYAASYYACIEEAKQELHTQARTQALFGQHRWLRQYLCLRALLVGDLPDGGIHAAGEAGLHREKGDGRHDPRGQRSGKL